MKLFAIVAALFVAVLPAASLARGCDKETANVCTDGFQWDEASGACVEIVSS